MTQSIAPTEVQGRLINEIRRLYRRGEPLNISAVQKKHPKLLQAVYRVKPFWGWKQALEAAGLDYSKIKIYLRKNVTCKVCGAHLRTLALHLRKRHNMPIAAYLELNPGAEMTSPMNSVRHYRENKKSLIPHWERNWTPEYTLDRVNEMKKKGIPIRSTYMCLHDNMTYVMCRKYFRSMSVVYTAIGADPISIHKRVPLKNWTKEEVKRRLLARRSAGLKINHGAVEEENYQLCDAARKLFGNYDTALRAAGWDPEKIRLKANPSNKYRTSSSIINEICRRKINGLPINYVGILYGNHRNPTLIYWARKYFGDWKSAVEAAGFDYDRINQKAPKYVTAEDVTEEIRKRQAGGLTLVSSKMAKPGGDLSLFRTGMKIFGLWGKAIEAAGISYSGICHKSNTKYPTKESILTEIKKRHESEKPLNSEALVKGPIRDKALYITAGKLFGSWKNAVTEAGLDYNKVAFPLRKSRREVCSSQK